MADPRLTLVPPEPGAPATGFEPDSPLVAEVIPSPNFGERRDGATASLIVLHYTGMASVDAAIRRLTTPPSKVSCHYVISLEGTITQLVPEALRSWHAGVSHWRGIDDVNSHSLGIEIQNRGYVAGFPPFPDAQIEAVIALCSNICDRTGIPRSEVIGHSDIAPRRKRDPGPRFPWGRLYQEAGLGRWVPPSPLNGGDVLSEGDGGVAVFRLQRQLRAFGYGIEATGVFDEHTAFVVEAFQSHFRPTLVDGRADHSTVETLDRLLASTVPETAV
jgi:N-acetylmuramoyl-L-alanine amidase